MNQNSTFLAVDLGATSGRTVLGVLTDGHVTLEELTRFPNPIIQMCGHHYWDIYALYAEIIRGLKAVAQRGIELTAIGMTVFFLFCQRQ